MTEIKKISNDRIKEILDTTKIIKRQTQPKNFKRILNSSTFRKHIMQGVTKCKNKRCGLCNIIIKGKSFIFEKLKETFIMNKNLRCNSKNVVYVIE